MKTDSLIDKERGSAGLWIVMVAAVALLLTAGFVLFQKQAVEQEAVPVGPLQVVRLGLALQPTNALAMIALANGYFQQQGLDPMVKTYPSGKRSLIDGLFTGDVDIVASADVPVAMAGLDGRDLRILATSFNADNVNSLIARRDRGITQTHDLRGKRVATQRASAVHFFLHLFLLENNLLEDDIQLSYMKAEQLPKALARGDIDAFSMREPFISQARELLGDNAVLFAEPGLYQQVELVVISQSLLKTNPEIARKYLLALLKAEKFAASQPQEAIRITAEHLDIETDKIAAMWPTFKLRITLDQTMLLLLESEARWVIKSGITDVTEVPNYMDMIAPGILHSIKPDAVSVIW